MVNAPIATINPPTAAINATSTSIPTNAPVPVTPTLLKIRQAADNANNIIDNEAAISNVGPTFIFASTPIIAANPAVTNVITPNVTYALGDTVPHLLMMIIADDKESNRIDNAAAEPSTESTGNCDNNAITPANIVIAPVMINNVLVAFFAK